MNRTLNVIGPQIRKLRDQRGWTQEVFAQKMQLAGWDVSRVSVAKLEARLRWTSDVEILFIARVFGVALNDLFPSGVNLKKIGALLRTGKAEINPSR